MGEGRSEDLAQRAAEVRVVRGQIRIGRVLTECRHHRLDGDKEPDDTDTGERTTRDPSSLGESEPESEADHRDGGVLARGQRENRGQCKEQPVATLGRPHRGQEQGHGESRRVKVADVDALERRIEQVEQRDRSGGAGADPGAREQEQRHRTKRQRHRLQHEQEGRPREDQRQRRQRIEDGAEVIAPRVPAQDRVVGLLAARKLPHALCVLAEVERMGPECVVTPDGDEAEDERVRHDADGHRSLGSDGWRSRRAQGRAGSDEDDQADQHVLGTQAGQRARRPRRTEQHEARSEEGDARGEHQVERADAGAPGHRASAGIRRQRWRSPRRATRGGAPSSTHRLRAGRCWSRAPT